MFLNRFARFPEILTALTEQKDETLGGMAEAMGVSVERLSALQQGAAEIGPAEEWALLGFCDGNGYYQLLADFGVTPPPYNRHRDFSFALPPIATEWPQRDLVRRPTNILGYEVEYPIGVPACALTFNSSWLKYFQDRGFCIFTHKTVRSGKWGGHPEPHWALVNELNGPLKYPFNEARVAASMTKWPAHPLEFSMVNSFGVPSLEAKIWQAEVAAEREMLSEGSMLIVSVMGTPEEADDEFDLAKDFARTAALAKDAGAQVIEANLSCPNTPPPPLGASEGRYSRRSSKASQDDIYTSPDMARLVCEAIRSEIGVGFPFLIKIGYLPPPELEELISAVSDTIDGVVAINTVRVSVDDSEGEPFFKDRPQAGLSGSLIKELAKDVLTSLLDIRSRLKPDLAIFGVGGVTTADDVHEFEDLGIDAVLSCTGAWMNPNLALEARLAQRVDKQGLLAAFGEETLAEAEQLFVTIPD